MYEDLEPLANLKLGKNIEAVSRETQAELTKVIGDYSARGLGYSGPLEAQKLRIRIEGAERLCRALYDIWLDLITRRNGRVSRADVEFIMAKVDRCAQAHGQSVQSAMQSNGGPAGGHLAQRAQIAMQALASGIRRDLEIRVREQDAFPVKAQAVIGDEVFVVVAATQDLQDLVDEAIIPAVKDNALRAYVMVVREPEGPIGNEILARIESARLVVADLTHERPNCYYEVGYAHAKGKKVIFTARRDHDPRRAGRVPGDPKIHFDLDSHRFSFWDSGEWSHLRAEIRTRISESLRLLDVGATAGDRRGKAGERELLSYMRDTQSSAHGRVVFNLRAVAQEVGWPAEDVQIIFSRLLEKALIAQYGDGFALSEAARV